MSIVLASGSSSRRSMLDAAGLEFLVDTPAVDEASVKQAMQADGAGPMDVAEALAEMKARQVSRRHPNAMVIGADQMLECGGVWFDKPVDLDHAQSHLVALRGKKHRLIASVVVVQNQARQWHHNDIVTLEMRPFSDAFLRSYLGRAGDAVLGSVGAYQLEGLGAQLFRRIEGDYFTVLGLPLLPLLDYLRTRGVLPL
ncbi:MAG: Maf family protein [Pseudomonadota bacterium]